MDELLRKDLKSPPFIRLPVQDYIGCSRLMKENNAAILILKTCISEKSSLWTEIDMLERAIYKMKAKWKLESLFRGTRQVLKCMKILKSQKILQTITTTLDSVLGLDGKTLVPSRQYLQYLLVKIIGVGRLAVQTIEYCVYVHSKLLAKMQIGHVLSSIMSFAAIISRIWILCHTLLVEIRSCYDSIYSLQVLASDADYAWLPGNVTLPDKFPFDVDAIIQRSSGCKAKVLAQHSSATGGSQSTQLNVKSSSGHKFVGEDVGVVISRESFAASLSRIKSSTHIKHGTLEGVQQKVCAKKKSLADEDANNSSAPVPVKKKRKSETLENEKMRGGKMAKKGKKKAKSSATDLSPESVKVSAQQEVVPSHITDTVKASVKKKVKEKSSDITSKKKKFADSLELENEDFTKTELTSDKVGDIVGAAVLSKKKKRKKLKDPKREIPQPQKVRPKLTKKKKKFKQR